MKTSSPCERTKKSKKKDIAYDTMTAYSRILVVPPFECAWLTGDEYTLRNGTGCISFEVKGTFAEMFCDARQCPETLVGLEYGFWTSKWVYY